MLFVEFSHTSFEVKVGYICRILKHGRWANLQEGNGGIEHCLDFQLITFEGRGAHENVMVYPQTKNHRPIKFT